MLRSSILYASETYYGLSEYQIRQIERIEESFLRKMFKTSRGCPLSQLYLESGHIPARFQIIKNRLLFFKYILKQDSESLINKFLKLQLKYPTRGDWASSCIENMKYLNIEMNIEEIKVTKQSEFKNRINEAIKIEALDYILKLRGSKGREIEYNEIKMADYLMPNRENLTLEDNKRYIFAIRNRMIQIPNNFPSKNENIIENCRICGEKEDMNHLYSCKWGQENERNEYENIFGNNLRKMSNVYILFRSKYENREKHKIMKNHPCDPICDPLFFVYLNSNGNISK